jgi:hypothetical protein
MDPNVTPMHLRGLACQGERQENYRTIDQGVTSNGIVAGGIVHSSLDPSHQLKNATTHGMHLSKQIVQGLLAVTTKFASVPAVLSWACLIDSCR